MLAQRDFILKLLRSHYHYRIWNSWRDSSFNGFTGFPLVMCLEWIARVQVKSDHGDALPIGADGS